MKQANIGLLGAVTLAVFAILTVGICGCEQPTIGDVNDAVTDNAWIKTISFSMRPASVPSDYLAMPDGYYHPSECLIRLQHGETLELDGYTVDHADGTKTTHPKCGRPNFDRSGNIADPRHYSPPVVGGWVADANEVISSVTWFSTTWSVPSNPSSDSQTVYFFPAIEPSTTGDQIIQPVLGWNFWGSDGNNWRVASVWCPSSGSCTYDGDYVVSAGDSLSGYMYPGSGTWNIGMNVNGTSKSFITKSISETMDWVFGGVLEAYNIQRCSDYPNGSSGSTTFGSIDILKNGSSFTPSFSNTWVSQCGSGVSSNSSSVTITY